MRKQLSEVTLPLWLGHLERWLEKAKTVYFVDDELTIADLVIYTRMKWLRRGVRTRIGVELVRHLLTAVASRCCLNAGNLVAILITERL